MRRRVYLILFVVEAKSMTHTDIHSNERLIDGAVQYNGGGVADYKKGPKTDSK
jgi:hypothetical protein